MAIMVSDLLMALTQIHFHPVLLLVIQQQNALLPYSDSVRISGHHGSLLSSRMVARKLLRDHNPIVGRGYQKFQAFAGRRRWPTIAG